jgi:hypothetical protein
VHGSPAIKLPVVSGGVPELNFASVDRSQLGKAAGGALAV